MIRIIVSHAHECQGKCTLTRNFRFAMVSNKCMKPIQLIFISYLTLAFVTVCIAQQQTKPTQLQTIKPVVCFRCPFDGEADPPRPKVKITRGDITRYALVLPQPKYPPQAKGIRFSGAVVVEVVVDVNSGKVIWARFANGHPLLREAVRKVVCQARFAPMNINSPPINLSGTITYRFER